MKAVLFRNLVEDGSQSMQRYARELNLALRSVAGDRWQFQDFVSRRPVPGSRLLAGKNGVRLDSAIGRYLKYPWQAARASGDLFHILDHGYAQLGLGLNPARTVVTCHDLMPLLAYHKIISMPIAPNVVYSFKFRLRCMERAAYVIADSEATKAGIIQFSRILPERIIVVPLGVSEIFSPSGDPDEIQTRPQKLGVPENTKLVMQVGTNRYKNTPALLHALQILKTTFGIEVCLLRVGANFYPDEAALITELGIENQIIEAGNVPDDATLAKLYRQVDLLAFPSLWEGFGWPPLEAMACGTPVVTSNAGALPEVVGNAALMVEPQNYPELAKALYAVLTREDLRASLIGQGLVQAKKFSWERTARQTLAVYERTLENA